jgi:hypothetical protein
MKWRCPRRVASVESGYVFVVKNHKELNVTAELAQAAEHNDHELYVMSKILDARYNKQEMFYALLVAWRGFPVGEAIWEP